MSSYEAGIGSLLCNAWRHFEVLEVTDADTLADHVVATLAAATSTAGREYLQEKMGEEVELSVVAKATSSPLGQGFHLLQELMVIRYTRLLVLATEEMGEDKILPILRTGNVLVLGIHVLDQCHTRLERPYLVECCEALALLADTEDYSTYRSQYLGSPDDLSSMIHFQEECLSELLEDMEVRRRVRALHTAIDAAKRLHSKK